MNINKSIITDIKAIILIAKDKAIRLVDHERTMMYWQIGKRIFEEEQQGNDRADYGSYLTNLLLNNWSRSTEVDFRKGRLSFSGSFTAHSQLRIHCIRN